MKNKITTYSVILFAMSSSLFAADGGASSNWAAYLGAGLGAGLVTIGAGFGIGKITAAAAEATGRQPEAAGDIRTTALIMSALIEGVALFCAVTCFLLSNSVG